MKRFLIYGGLGLVLILAIAAAYYFFWYEEPKPPRQPRDPNAWTIPPVSYPMKGYTFSVPDYASTTVTLDLVYPTAKRNYPMARFTSAMGTGEGSFYAMDDLATPVVDGKQVVPIVVMPGTGEALVYLAELRVDGENRQHTKSIYLGDRILLSPLTQNGAEITIPYLVHDRLAPRTDIPTVSTTAIVNIDTATFVQEGKKPWLQEVIEVKSFAGTYFWKETKSAEGTVTPSKPDVFSLIFDTNRITLTTDCNTGSSDFTPPTGSSTDLTFGPIVSTKKFCESSEEGPYFEMIAAVERYAEVDADALLFTLTDGREMVFTKPTNTLPFASEEITSVE
jgi:heat shock protein HslJ